MKCTTKILIGILLSGIVVVTVGATLVVKLSPRIENLRIDGEPVQMEIAPFRLVNVKLEVDGQLKEKYISVEGDFSILPANGGQSVLSCPEGLKRYLTVVTRNDTLNLIFKLSAQNLSDAQKNRNWMSLEYSKMTLTADSSLVAVQSDVPYFTVNLKHLASDSVSLNSAFLNVDSCHFRSISVKDTRDLQLKNSQIQNVYLDLDNVNRWNTTGCRLENEYLTGNGDHRNNLQKGECRNMYWKPKSENAQLNVTFNEGASVSLLN